MRNYDHLPADLKELILVRLHFCCPIALEPYEKKECSDCQRDSSGRGGRHWKCCECGYQICDGREHTRLGRHLGYGKRPIELKVGSTIFKCEAREEAFDQDADDPFVCLNCFRTAIEVWCLEDWEFAHGYTRFLERPKWNGFKQKAREKITPTVRHEVFKRDGFKCKLCGLTSDSGKSLVVDHIIPVAKGGTNSERNLQTLCDSCNAGKGAR